MPIIKFYQYQHFDCITKCILPSDFDCITKCILLSYVNPHDNEFLDINFYGLVIACDRTKYTLACFPSHQSLKMKLCDVVIFDNLVSVKPCPRFPNKRLAWIICSRTKRVIGHFSVYIFTTVELGLCYLLLHDTMWYMEKQLGTKIRVEGLYIELTSVKLMLEP